MVAVGFVATFGRNGTLNGVLGALGLPPVDLMFTLEAIVIAHAFYNAARRPGDDRGVGVGRRECGRDRSEPRRGADPAFFFDVVAPQVYPAVLTGAALTFVFTFGTFPIVPRARGFELATVEVFVYPACSRPELRRGGRAGDRRARHLAGVLLAYLRYEARNTVSSRGSDPSRAGLSSQPPPPSERCFPGSASPPTPSSSGSSLRRAHCLDGARERHGR